MESETLGADWNRGTRYLHWLMAVLMVMQAAVGWIGGELDRSPLKVEVMTAHKSLGITLLLLLVLRLLWRWLHPPPPPPEGSRPWEILAAKLSHALLYFLMFAVPVSGWMAASTSIIPWKLWWVLPWPSIAPADQVWHEIAEDAHEALVRSLLVVLAVHVAAALQHHFVKRDTVLVRMLRARK